MSTRRRSHLFSSNWTREGEELIYTVRGGGFLHHMVRNLVGTFLLIGKGTVGLEDLRRILDTRQRTRLGPTAPASRLYLVEWMRVNTPDYCHPSLTFRMSA